jgi:hypothetical protein
MAYRIAAFVASLMLLALLAPAANAEPAWHPKRKALQDSYIACKARLSKEPPCANVWTKHCARMCGGRY